MEGLVMPPIQEMFRGKRVWVSGHTGFKGSWLTEWLLQMGAIVHGYALEPDTTPSLFDLLGLRYRIGHEVADIRNAALVRSSIQEFCPDYLFHLAAQPLVRRSYAFPVETYGTNVMGTIHVLESLREISHPCSAVVVTTDKVYENLESGRAYEEADPLGGRDPYSSSKAMAEIATAAYHNSYFQNGLVRIACARAGNVIGGGDWAEDRIVPDAMRALDGAGIISVRNPAAVRPWQHVLEPLGGYLLLASKLGSGATCAESFNFGPREDSNRTVADLVTEILKHRKGKWIDASQPGALHEAKFLNLSIKKADRVLHWRPVWGFETTVEKTVEWYQGVHAGMGANGICNRQINEYTLQANLLIP